jgi:hypothetical protein
VLGSGLAAADLEWSDTGLLVRTRADTDGGVGWACDADMFWWTARPRPAPSTKTGQETTEMQVDS